MSTNPTDEQRVYQRRHRAKKQQEGRCTENGCRTLTLQYRCTACRRLHTDREIARQRRRR